MNKQPASAPRLRIDRAWIDQAEGLSPFQLMEQCGPCTELDCTADLLTCGNLRQLLFKLDAILALGGTIEIECVSLDAPHGAGRRSANQIQYAFGCLFHGNYRLVSRERARLRFAKTAQSRSYAVQLGELSMGFISDGSALAQLDRILGEIYTQASLRVEVMICGPRSKLEELRAKYTQLRLLPDIEHADLRPPINRKKAALIQAASCENLVLAHDRFFFDRSWFEGLVRFGNVFDFYNCRRCDWAEYPAEVRVQGDWAFMRQPATGFGPEAISGTAESFGQSNPDLYLNGGLYVGKTALFRQVGWPAHLHWGDLEDVHFSRQLELAGAVVQADAANRVFTTVKRLGRYHRGGLLRRLKARLGSKMRRHIFISRYGRDFVD